MIGIKNDHFLCGITELRSVYGVLIFCVVQILANVEKGFKILLMTSQIMSSLELLVTSLIEDPNEIITK